MNASSRTSVTEVLLEKAYKATYIYADFNKYQQFETFFINENASKLLQLKINSFFLYVCSSRVVLHCGQYSVTKV